MKHVFINKWLVHEHARALRSPIEIHNRRQEIKAMMDEKRKQAVKELVGFGWPYLVAGLAMGALVDLVVRSCV